MSTRENRRLIARAPSAMYSNDVVVNFNDVLKIAHCLLNIESTQHIAILTFEWTL